MKITYHKIFQVACFTFFSSLIFISVGIPTTAQSEEVAPGVWLSTNGEFRVSFASSINPVPLQTSHQWTFFILTGKRAPVSDAVMEIHGYHPATRETLNRETYISPHLGRGTYVVDNMYFEGAGEWELNLIITSGSTTDAVLIPISI